MAPGRDLRWFRRDPTESIRYLLFDRELDNFTYRDREHRRAGRVHRRALGTDRRPSGGTSTNSARTKSSRGDPDAARKQAGPKPVDAIRTAARVVRGRSDPTAAADRRDGRARWTRVDGAPARPRAQRGGGIPGSTRLDRYPAGRSGWLIPDELRERHQLVIGDPIATITASGDRSSDRHVHPRQRPSLRARDGRIRDGDPGRRPRMRS